MSLSFDILATLSYFDLFQYPLTGKEVSRFLRHSYPSGEVQAALHDLCAENWIFKFDGVYCLHPDPKLLLRRKKANDRARARMDRAGRLAAFFSRFPFVTGVAVYGPLSSHYVEEESGLHFLIITRTNRLWIARMLLQLFRKFTCLFHRRQSFCMHQYIDESALELPEKNIYTATELATLLPLRGIDVFEQFFLFNRWSREFLPSHVLRVSHVKACKSSILKWLMEILLDNRAGDLLDSMLRKANAKAWKNKTKGQQRNGNGRHIALDAGRHQVRPSPHVFQEKFLQAYEKKMVNLFYYFETRVKTIF